jgi:hypothetical protein
VEQGVTRRAAVRISPRVDQKEAGVAFFLKQARQEMERNGGELHQVDFGDGSKRKPEGRGVVSARRDGVRYGRVGILVCRN